MALRSGRVLFRVLRDALDANPVAAPWRSGLPQKTNKLNRGAAAVAERPAVRSNKLSRLRQSLHMARLRNNIKSDSLTGLASLSLAEAEKERAPCHSPLAL